MAGLGVFHPQVVHFVIALLIVGVGFRVLALTGRFRFMGPAATTLIILGTIAAFAAVYTGDKAHGIAERIPGARNAVVEHEEWGERTRNLFAIVSILEIAALIVANRAQRGGVVRGLRVASALVGLAGLWVLYETGEHGGELVYAYAGGVGTRSGEPEDVQRLLVAGLYHNAMQARKDGNHEQAAQLIDQLAQQSQDPSVRQLQIESMILDRNDPRGALQQIEQLPASTEPRARTRIGMLRADAYVKLGQRDSASAVMEALRQEFPANARVRAKADSLKQ